MKTRLETAHRPQIQGKKVEEERAVRFRGQGDHFSFLVLSRVIVNPLQVGGLSAKTWTVIHQLAINFARGKIDERHFVVNQNSATNLQHTECRQASFSPACVTRWALSPTVSAKIFVTPRSIF